MALTTSSEMHAGAATSKTHYVAMGDSFSSGEANSPFTNTTGCDVSAKSSWPLFVAASMNDTIGNGTFLNVACSGAEIGDLDAAWTERQQDPQISQLNGLKPSLVTITIGGNSMIQGSSPNSDWGFANVLGDCYVTGIASIVLTRSNLAGCNLDGTLSKADAAVTSTDSTSGLKARLVAAYKEIRAAVPVTTHVLVVGYPNIVPPKWSASTALHCPWLGPNDITGLNKIAGDLNDTIKSAASKAGVSFVSTLNALSGHTLCTGTSYVQSVSPATGWTSSAGHPIKLGQQAMANAVEAWLIDHPIAPPTLGLHSYGLGYGAVAPARVFNGGDPTGDVGQIKWQSWGKASAIGTGISEFVAPGQTVSEGTEESATIVAFNLGKCGGHSAYQAVEWYFPQEGDSFNPGTYINACTGNYVIGPALCTKNAITSTFQWEFDGNFPDFRTIWFACSGAWAIGGGYSPTLGISFGLLKDIGYGSWVFVRGPDDGYCFVASPSGTSCGSLGGSPPPISHKKLLALIMKAGLAVTSDGTTVVPPSGWQPPG
jgi:lysophospholipase L1-like esterase